MKNGRITSQNFNEHVCVFKHLSISNPETAVTFEYRKMQYTLKFQDSRLKGQSGFVLARKDSKPCSTSLLKWLAVYFGEYTLNHSNHQELASSSRGHLTLERDSLIGFITATERYTRRFRSSRRQQLISSALNYYLLALQGSSNQPVALGFYAASMECLINAHYGNAAIYLKLDERLGRSKIFSRIRKRQKEIKQQDGVRRFGPEVKLQMDMLAKIRSALIGDTLMHFKTDRMALTKDLRAWLKHQGHARSVVKHSFRENQLYSQIQKEYYALHKIGLRLNRTIIMSFVGHKQAIPFASHDFLSSGEQASSVVYNLQSKRQAQQAKPGAAEKTLPFHKRAARFLKLG